MFYFTQQFWLSKLIQHSFW